MYGHGRPGRNANRQVEGGRVLRAAKPDPGSGDFDCEKNSTLASSKLDRAAAAIAIPKRPQGPRLLVHLIHARVRWWPTSRGVPAIIPRVHGQSMNSRPVGKKEINGEEAKQEDECVEGGKAERSA